MTRPHRPRSPGHSGPGDAAALIGPHRGLLALAVLVAVLAMLAAGYWWADGDAPAGPSASGAPASPEAAAAAQGTGLSVWKIQEKVPTWKGPQTPAVAAAAPDPEGDNDPTHDLRFYVPRGLLPTMAEVIEKLQEAGETTGLAAFSPPGTRPHLVGLAVPPDFVLPAGYVRHYQATDDGQRIEPILLFAHGSAAGESQHVGVESPKNRVVPAHLAPPGMPIRTIVLPTPLDPLR